MGARAPAPKRQRPANSTAEPAAKAGGVRGGGSGGDKITGAAAATEVTHGITLRGAQLTWAILRGVKKVENRHFRMSPGWYALHTGQKTSSHESQHELIASVAEMPPETELPHGAIVGAIKITHGAPARHAPCMIICACLACAPHGSLCTDALPGMRPA